MKKFISLIICVTLLSACAQDLTVGNKTYESYGLLSQDKKESTIKYKACWGNIIWGSLLFETVIAPIYFFGFSMYEPVSKN